MKVKALLAWAEQNTSAGNYTIINHILSTMIINTGSNRHKVLQPVLKNIQLQYISAQDLMKVNNYV